MKVACLVRYDEHFQKTGEGKAVADFYETLQKKLGAEEVELINILDNKKILKHLCAIVKSKASLFYFTPSGSVGGNLRDLLLMSFLWLCQKKYVLHFHNSSYGNILEKNMFLRLCNVFFLKKACSIWLLGKKQEEMFSPFFSEKEKFWHIYNGVETSLFLSKEKLQEKLEKTPKKVLYFSNMIEEKGYPLVLKLAKEMKEEKDFHFVFSGKFFQGAEEKRALFLKEMEHAENMTFYEGVYGKEKEELLSQAHFFVLPSEYKEETLPISMLEAMASGAFVLVTPRGVMEEVLLPQTSYVLRTEEKVQEMKKALLHHAPLLSNYDYQLETLKQRFEKEKIQEAMFQKIYTFLENPSCLEKM